MPDVTHRWCKWHVFQKMRESIGSLFKKGSPFRNKFTILTNEMMTIDEFEKEWQEIVLSVTAI